MRMLKSIWPWLAAILALFAPIQGAIITALVMILADLITGVWAAWKRKEPITSSGIKRTVAKIVLYELAITLGYLCQTYLTHQLLPVCSLISSVVGLTEMASILENLQSINPNINFKYLVSKFTNAETLGEDNNKK